MKAFWFHWRFCTISGWSFIAIHSTKSTRPTSSTGSYSTISPTFYTFVTYCSTFGPVFLRRACCRPTRSACDTTTWTRPASTSTACVWCRWTYSTWAWRSRPYSACFASSKCTSFLPSSTAPSDTPTIRTCYAQLWWCIICLPYSTGTPASPICCRVTCPRILYTRSCVRSIWRSRSMQIRRRRRPILKSIWRPFISAPKSWHWWVTFPIRKRTPTIYLPYFSWYWRFSCSPQLWVMSAISYPIWAMPEKTFNVSYLN